MTDPWAGWLPVLFAQQAEQGPVGLMPMVPALVVIMFLFYMMIIRPERAKQKSHQELLGRLKKNDRVVTVGGIYGVVTNVQRDTDEITIRVDESTNTKLRITFGAVSRVLVEAEETEKSAKTG